MAGDWMKIELELPEKPEVHSIAAMLGKEPEWVVGALIKVWGWFNKHTEDGNAPGVTFALPDRLVGVTGFGEAMCFAGWLEQNDRTLTMPKFDRHTSESAKTRANTASRVSRYKNNVKESNAEGNGDSVTKVTVEALQREEKSKQKKKQQTSLPDGLEPNARNISLAEELGLIVGDEFEKFKDHHGSKNSTYADWNLAFNTWLRNAVKFSNVGFVKTTKKPYSQMTIEERHREAM